MSLHGCHRTPQLIEPEERWKVAGWQFEVWPQIKDQFAVKAIPDDGSGAHWLRDPESRFESFGGARLAILTFLEGLTL